MNITLVRASFLISAIYDGFFGIMGVLVPNLAFRVFETTPPNHTGYIRFPAILLLIFGWMFFEVARNPSAHRDLMLYGIALKVGYSSLVFSHMLTTGIPGMWVPWAWIDLGFIALFVWSYRYTGRLATQLGA